DLRSGSVGAGFGLTDQVVDQDFGMDLLLDVERRSRHNQAGPVLIILPAPDELRIEIPVAAVVSQLDRRLLLLPHQRLVLDSRQILPLRLVAERSDGFAFGRLLGFRFLRHEGNGKVELRIMNYEDWRSARDLVRLEIVVKIARSSSVS